MERKNQKFGMVASCLPGVAEIDALEKIKNAGFDTVFCEESHPQKVALLKEKCDRLGLSLDFLHAPFAGINCFWTPGMDFQTVRDGIYSSIDAASRSGIPMIVSHVSSGWRPPQLSDVGFSRFDAMVDYAISKNVKVAFENLRKVGNLAAIMERYEDVSEVGFCYDCGHEHCYTETVHFLELYGDRLFCTHIHDNHGRDRNDYYGNPDEHLMPFDGNVDFADMMKRLRGTNYAGALTLELEKNASYLQKSDEEFLAIALERIKRISESE